MCEGSYMAGVNQLLEDDEEVSEGRETRGEFGERTHSLRPSVRSSLRAEEGWPPEANGAVEWQDCLGSIERCRIAKECKCPYG
jgi:hypothetical protein